MAKAQNVRRRKAHRRNARNSNVRRKLIVSGESFTRGIALTGQRLTQPLPSHSARPQEYKEAVQAFDAALAATVKYLDRLARGGNPDKNIEDELSVRWRNTAYAVRPFDPQLSDQCLMKGQGWLDPRLWSDPEFRNLSLSIRDMRNGLRQLNQIELPAELPNWFPKAGAAFAAATFISMLYLMGADLKIQNRIIFDAWLAFCVAASGTFIGGSAAASGTLSLPFFKRSPIKFSAFGGVAIFIVIFLILYGAHHYQ